MKIAVFDTYVTRQDGSVMHFDILVPDAGKHEAQVYAFGRDYLAAKGQGGQPLTSAECSFCHIEQASEEIVADIAAKGYSIIEMEGCQTV